MCRLRWILVPGLFFATSLLCGCGDPALDRLEVGQRAIFVRDEASKASGETDYKFVIFTPHGTKNFTTADLGTEAVIVEDEGEVSDGHREISLRIKDGPLRETSGTVKRNNLRPLK